MLLSENDFKRVRAAQQAVYAAEQALQVIFEADNPLLGEICEGMMEELTRMNAKLQRISVLAAQGPS